MDHPSTLDYVASAENLGSAGGWALGMERLLADDTFDWLMPLDDDDPPVDEWDFQRMIEFALTAKEEVDNLAAVGIIGARFNWRRGLIERLGDHELEGRVDVDYVGSGHMPLYHRDAISTAGVFDAKLFFGYTEVEYGIRLKRAGFKILANAEMWRERRREKKRIGVQPKPAKLCAVSARKYYVIRNHIYITLKNGRWDAALKQATIQCLLKPAYTFFSDPKLAFAGARQAIAACWNGMTGRMGRRNEPGDRDPTNRQTAELDTADHDTAKNTDCGVKQEKPTAPTRG